MEIGADIRTQEQYPGDVAADNADEVEQRGEQGKADDGSSDSWTDEVPERINAHGVKGVNLLGDTLDSVFVLWFRADGLWVSDVSGVPPPISPISFRSREGERESYNDGGHT